MEETHPGYGSKAEFYWPSIAFPRSHLGILLSLTCSIVAAVFTGNYAHQQQFIFVSPLASWFNLIDAEGDFGYSDSSCFFVTQVHLTGKFYHCSRCNPCFTVICEKGHFKPLYT